jgi:hypothetical protein
VSSESRSATQQMSRFQQPAYFMVDIHRLFQV